LIRCFKRDEQDSADGCDHADNQERLARQPMGLDRRTHSVKDLDDHQDEEQSVDDAEKAADLWPLNQSVPSDRERTGER
jgi:hypothetical protein